MALLYLLQCSQEWSTSLRAVCQASQHSVAPESMLLLSPLPGNLISHNGFSNGKDHLCSNTRACLTIYYIFKTIPPAKPCTPCPFSCFIQLQSLVKIQLFSNTVVSYLLSPDIRAMGRPFSLGQAPFGRWVVWGFRLPALARGLREECSGCQHCWWPAAVAEKAIGRRTAAKA